MPQRIEERIAVPLLEILEHCESAYNPIEEQVVVTSA
jgi:hypothetical protein